MWQRERPRLNRLALGDKARLACLGVYPEKSILLARASSTTLAPHARPATHHHARSCSSSAGGSSTEGAGPGHFRRSMLRTQIPCRSSVLRRSFHPNLRQSAQLDLPVADAVVIAGQPKSDSRLRPTPPGVGAHHEEPPAALARAADLRPERPLGMACGDDRSAAASGRTQRQPPERPLPASANGRSRPVAVIAPAQPNDRMASIAVLRATPPSHRPGPPEWACSIGHRRGRASLVCAPTRN